MTKNLLLDIDRGMSGFSKGQKRIGNYILENYDKAAFMTASKLGATVGVSESTVVRFAMEIGFEGYPQLQRALQEMIRSKLTSVQRMEVTTQQIGTGDVLNKVLGADIEKIRRTLEETDKALFQSAVEDITAAKKIYVIGIGSASVLSGYLSFYFNHIFDNVRNLDPTSASGIFEQIMRIQEGDLLIGITFSRYSRRTVKAAGYAKDSGAKVIALTDSVSAPIAEIADYTLLARSDMTSFVDSLVAPLSLINALIVAIGLKKKDDIRASYQKLERIWDEYDVYDKGEE